MSRLKVSIWVQAYVRTCNGAGAFAAIVRHGDDDAGAVFIKVAGLDGTAALYAPAPTGLSDADIERRWLCRLQPGSPETIVDDALARERDFDSDLWIVEIEDRQRRHFLDDWLLAPGPG